MLCTLVNLDMKYILSLIMFLCLHAVGQTTLNKSSHATTENKVLSLIDNLPDFKKADAYYTKKSGGKHLSTILINDKGNEDGHFYLIDIDEDMGDHYYTLYHFYIDNKTFEINYWDVEKDRKIPLSVWRKQKDYLRLD